ncbi:MAG: GNAT family N-acetyltransferase [Bacteroidetes bacterium]|nr:GNAT family N-acetyltransferase [Crocinitomicaceae bacterium]MCH9821965.1 GNAT family N-acetyltransferase [Bacteroidota bacterium]|tara:strand:+ start:37439 stop:37900 length:462 start_codon:yes stop_codon:yes gene_type:complete
MNKNNIQLRKGTPSDIPELLNLIKELAAYEKEPDAVIVTEEILLEDGFGENSIFDFIVAEKDEKVAGIALYYSKYSTWKGRCLYLEDIIVKESERMNGIGSLLLKELIAIADKAGVKRLEWQVLDWNEPAINFYKKHKAIIDGEWLNCKVEFE